MSDVGEEVWRMEFRILGPLEIVADEPSSAVTVPNQQQALLAVLLLRANRMVATWSLIDELWAENRPAKPETALRTAVSRLQRRPPGQLRQERRPRPQRRRACLQRLQTLARVKNFSFAVASVGPWEMLLGRRYRRTRRVAASRGGCPSTEDDNRKGKYQLLSISNLYRTGGLAASPGSCRIIAGRSTRTYGMGVTK
jgi:hypothetical protein